MTKADHLPLDFTDRALRDHAKLSELDKKVIQHFNRRLSEAGQGSVARFWQKCVHCPVGRAKAFIEGREIVVKCNFCSYEYAAYQYTYEVPA